MAARHRRPRARTRWRPRARSWRSSPRWWRSPATWPTRSIAASWSPPPARGSTCWSTTRACSGRARSRRSPTTRSTCSSDVYRVNVLAPLALFQTRARAAARRAPSCVNVTSDAAVEPYEGWGGYGSSKAALEQLTRILGAEHPDLRVLVVDPGDMRTQMHQEAFPGEDISDRPLPEDERPGPADLDRGLAERALPGERGDACMSAALAFELPERLEATEPPPERDEVRLLVASGDGLGHHRFTDLPDLLRARRPARRQHLGDAPRRAARRRRRCGCISRRRCRAVFEDDGHERWVVELRDGIDAIPRRPRGRAAAAPRRGDGGALGAVPGRAAAVGRAAHAPRAAARLPRPATASRSATATCPSRARSRTSRRSSRSSRAAPRCRAPAARSAAACWRR